MDNNTRTQIIEEIKLLDKRIEFLSLFEIDCIKGGEVMLEMMWATRLLKYTLQRIELYHKLRTL